MFLTTDRLGRLTRSRFVAPVAVALAILVLTINEIGYFSLNRTTAARDAALDGRVIVDHLRRKVMDAESAQRGYLLTERETYKPAYDRAMSDLRTAIAQVDALATKNPAQRESLQRLSALAGEKFAEMEDSVRLADAGDHAGALGLVLTDIGREQMVAIDQLADRLAADETSTFAAAGVLRDRTMQWSRLGIALLVALCLAAVFVALRLARAREKLAIQRESERIEQRNALQVERDKLEQEVEHRTHELTVLATHLQTVREDERSRLARELHDELGGLLTAAKLDLARVKNRLASAGPEVTQRINHLVKTLDAGIALKRRIIEDLRPSSLSNLGLTPALQILCAEFAKRSEIEVVANLDEVRLPEESALSVYRLVQEALTNVAKYAGARRVQVELHARDGKAVVSVTDDGCGFDLDKQKKLSGHGLAGMRFRVHSRGGSMTLRSAQGHGTRIEAALPLPAAPAQQAERITS